MKTLLLIVLLVVTFSGYAAKTKKDAPPAPADQTVVHKPVENKPSPFWSVKEIAQQSGRKLTLAEKISIVILKKQLRKAYPGSMDRQAANTNAVLGFAFACASFLFGLFVIPGLILSNSALKAERRDPGILTRTNKSLAKIGQVVSYVYIGLVLVALIFLAILFALWVR